MRFEKGFFIGAATAAHQVEGNNRNSDDYALELLPHGALPSPPALPATITTGMPRTSH